MDLAQGGGSNDDEPVPPQPMRCAYRRTCAREICAHLELDRRRQDRPPDEPRAVGQIGPPAFFMPSPANSAVRDTEAARPTRRPPSDRTRGFRRFPTSPYPPHRTRILESHVTALLSPELKNGSTEQSPLPVRVAPPVKTNGMPALLIEDVTKKFIVGRKKKPVMAISHVSMRLERGDIQGVLGANGSGKSTLIRLVS